MKRLPSTAGLVLLMLVLLFPMGAWATHSPDFQKMKQAMDELAQKSGQDFEIAYINAIIPHHQDALAMAKMVQMDAPHQEVRDQAAKMIQDQQKEIDDLTKWLSDWYGQQVTPDARMKMSQAMMDMFMHGDATMREKHFLAMMREHHQSAIDIGQMVLQKAAHQELKDQAQMMITMQREEQTKFGEWLQTWYNITPPQPTGDMQHGMDAVMPAQPATATAPAATAPATTAPPATTVPATPGAPRTLPDTSERSSTPWWAIGLAAVVLLGGGLLLRRKET